MTPVHSTDSSEEGSRRRHPTASWVVDVTEMEARLQRRSSLIIAPAVTQETYLEGDEPA